jgi:hypothetical protein
MISSKPCEKEGKALGSTWLSAWVMHISTVMGNMDPEICARSRGTLLIKNDFKQNMVCVGSLRYMALARISKAAVIKSVAIFCDSNYCESAFPQRINSMAYLVSRMEMIEDDEVISEGPCNELEMLATSQIIK